MQTSDCPEKLSVGRLPWHLNRRTLWKYIQVYQDFVDRGLTVEEVMEVHGIKRSNVYRIVALVRDSGIYDGVKDGKRG